jgi:hypothetical protein
MHVKTSHQESLKESFTIGHPIIAYGRLVAFKVLVDLHRGTIVVMLQTWFYFLPFSKIF